MKLPVKRLPLPPARTTALTLPAAPARGRAWSVGVSVSGRIAVTSEELLAAGDAAAPVDVEEADERPERHQEREGREDESAQAGDTGRPEGGRVDEGGDRGVGEERGQATRHDGEERQPSAPPPL